MACKNTSVLRQSIFLLAIYNMGIYLPLIMICICARAMMPDLGKESDEVIPRMALMLTAGLPLGSWISGLILAAPFGAIMATVSCFLLVIASGLVRDVYQRFVNPQATEHELRRLTYIAMALIGLRRDAAEHQSGREAADAGDVQLRLRGLGVSDADGDDVLLAAGDGGGRRSPRCWPGRWLRSRSESGRAGHRHALIKTGFRRPTTCSASSRSSGASASSLIVGIVVSLITPPPDERLVSKLFDAEPQAA